MLRENKRGFGEEPEPVHGEIARQYSTPLASKPHSKREMTGLVLFFDDLQKGIMSSANHDLTHHAEPAGAHSKSVAGPGRKERRRVRMDHEKHDG